ncbi:hypothetical protein [Streptacidiphilus sp. P02-A3a]|uniref:hypothetical protein n=1 Tax=Streptacidiphilus sp. P02-A3a TaxID=2704468 RepID=UPI0015F9D9DE|nr:hypothetical protein [Streptacidiphilus sp. P02-A3a]QMU69978.1 hypothetical protein GXP74_18845 [Streptacidiphilus sp. P02-A3a]
MLGAPTAQAATTGHCTSALSGPGITSPTLTPIFFAQLSACGGSFTDQGAPYTFTLDSIAVFYMSGSGMLTSFAYHNLIATCTAVTVSNGGLSGSGCVYAA